ncbi:MAG: metalloregulator ArsR/SmtB family transcription factor [Leptospirales bacterium]|jgi:ArsR family transcriptional regulator
MRTARSAALFSRRSGELAEVFRALAHPARIEILRVLARRGVCVCGEIVDVLPLSQASVSQHLKALLEAGLIKGRLDGTRSCYCLNIQRLKKSRAIMERLFDRLDPVDYDDRCC